jgi:hypothetical protein
MLPRYSRGNIRGGRDPACWEGPGPDAALPRARHMDPKASSTRDQHAAGWKGGAERRLGERVLSEMLVNWGEFVSLLILIFDYLKNSGI